MPDLYIRNIPDGLYERIWQRAHKRNRSMSAEVIELLQIAIGDTKRSPGEILAGIRRRRCFHPADVGAPDSAVLLHEDRER